MQIMQAADLLTSSRYPIALSGAGISTPSGIPDFRSSDNGLWNRFNPMEVASLSAFRTKPEKFFDWFRPLARLIFDAKPNPAHTALAELEQRGLLQTIITQNIDNLHQRAGSQNVIEVHGAISSLTCGQCFQKTNVEEVRHAYFEENQIPTCKSCGGILKPDVILFGEQMPMTPWLTAEQEINKCDLLLVVGSSLEVNPVAKLPFEVIAKGGKLIIINKQITYINSRADIVFRKDAAEVLPAILEAIKNGE
jgi:NAD-dependent deacetylase